ncbi:hypothetical protein HY383_01735 [Candidatus Daviesbacteria bacterium]|nr:hypothetical protein [Candidatus Daviesbacteria bacterium]
MERVKDNFTGRIRRVFFPTSRPKVPSLRFHISSGTDQIPGDRVTRLIDNDARARLLQYEGKYSPKAVISGQSGIYNVLVFAQVLSLSDAERLIKAESRAVEVAPLYTPALERFLGKFQKIVDELDIKKEPKIMLIGGTGTQISTTEEIKKEIVRQAIRPYDEQLLDNALGLLGIQRPLEIGLEPKGGNIKYVIGATVIGIGGVIAILALRRYQSRRRSR